MAYNSRHKDSYNVSLLNFIERPLFRQFGRKATNSCFGSRNTGPWTVFPRNCIVLMSIIVCTLGMLLNLLRISSTVILCFITCHRLMLMIFLVFLLTNLSNFFDRSTRSAQLSHPQSNKLIGLAIKIKYFEYILISFLPKKLFKAPIDLIAGEIRMSMSWSSWRL